ncbi:MAG: hypothetical protein GYB39_03800 [Algicola sp.]|nr:hypothetical protein [Algicola sp.]
MDLGITIIEVVLIAICIIPFILMGLSKAKNKKQQLQLLTKLAQKEQCKMDTYEVFANISIGLDTSKKRLLFVRQDNDTITQESIDLLHIKNCNLIKASNNNNAPKDISKLELALAPTSNNKTETRLLFFDIATEMPLSGQLQLAEKWNAIINKQ